MPAPAGRTGRTTNALSACGRVRRSETEMRVRATNMQRDILIMNMEHQLHDIAQERFGKSAMKCTDTELYCTVMVYCKRLLQVTERAAGEKKVYLIARQLKLGRLLSVNLINLRIYDHMKKLLGKYGRTISQLEEQEPEAADIGEFDSAWTAGELVEAAATVGIPMEGFALREDTSGASVEEEGASALNLFLSGLDRWENVEESVRYVRLHGKNMPVRVYDYDIVGYDSFVNKIRLISPPKSAGSPERLSDLERMYTLASGAARCILGEMKARKYDLNRLYDHAVIQLTGDFTALIIPELIRIMTEDKAMSLDEVIRIVAATCYCSMDSLPEKPLLISVPELVETAGMLLPVIWELDERARARSQDPDLLIIDKDNNINVTNIALHFAFSVILKDGSGENVLSEKYRALYPGKFSVRDNGVSFRRWLLASNHPLADYLSQTVSDAYKWDPVQLERLMQHSGDEAVLGALRNVKKENKLALTGSGESAVYDMLLEYPNRDSAMLFSEYIRHRYNRIKDGWEPEVPVIFFVRTGGEGCSRETGDVFRGLQKLVGGDEKSSRFMRIICLEDLNASAAQRLAAACDLVENLTEKTGTCGSFYSRICELGGAACLSLCGDPDDGRTVTIAGEQVAPDVENGGDVLDLYIRAKDRFFENCADRNYLPGRMLESIAQAGRYSADLCALDMMRGIWMPEKNKKRGKK